KNPVDAVVFSDDALTEQTRILTFALFVDCNGVVGAKIVACVDHAVVRINAVAIIVDIIAEDVQPSSNGNRNIRTLREEFEQKLQQLPASVFVLLRNVPVLPLDGQVIVNEVRRFEHKVVVQRDGYDENLAGFLFRRFHQVKVALCLYRRTEQSEFELFFDHARSRTGASREEKAVCTLLDGEGGIGFQRLEVGKVFLPAIHLVGPETVHEIRENLDVKQVQPCTIDERRQTK